MITLIAAALIALMSGGNVIDDDEDASMTIRRISGQNICKARTARVLAEMLIEDIHGEQALRAQLPLQVSEKSDRWVITGKSGILGREHPTGLAEGPVEIQILKANCRVTKFAGTLS